MSWRKFWCCGGGDRESEGEEEHRKEEGDLTEEKERGKGRRSEREWSFSRKEEEERETPLQEKVTVLMEEAEPEPVDISTETEQLLSVNTKTTVQLLQSEDAGPPSSTPLDEETGSQEKSESIVENFGRSLHPELMKVEPFFITLALFDVAKGCKISEDFHVDLNPSCVREMLTEGSPQTPTETEGGEAGGAGKFNSLPTIQRVSESLLRFPTQGIFSVTVPNTDIFLVARVEKVLQNGITHCAEPYIKTSDMSKIKIELLVDIHEKHHLLFTFYHISCELSNKASSKKREGVETLVGYAWTPLLKDGRIQSSDLQLPVSANLPAGYLYDKNHDSKKSSPDIKWVENAKPLFKVKTYTVSTIQLPFKELQTFI